MTFQPMNPPRVATRDEWLAARLDLLAREKAVTRELDALREQRRALPWVPVEKDYVFETPDGPRRLGELFDGRSQLAVYHFMLAPGSEHICDGCALLADHIDAASQHFSQADLAFVAISRAPLDRIAEVKRRMGWRFRWVSSGGTDFNYDFGVSFREGAANARYNYEPIASPPPDLHGASIFAKDAGGRVHHTYSAFARGAELAVGAFNWLDLAPKGRNEDGIMSWVRLHDEYDQPAEPAASCCA